MGHASTFSCHLYLSSEGDETLVLIPKLREIDLSSTVASVGDSDSIAGENGGGMSAEKKRSGTTARGKRLLKVRDEKRKRKYDRLHDYPSWAKYSLLHSNIGNPELMRKKLVEKVRKKGKDFQKQKIGFVLSFKVSFKE
ncbi:unnamed protein product [Eruca vesicaria subsp. sativa]|uniref:Uncharacterized protein n=1 Tax=Eruca vesicaria subsp. sativa TaxID=29727 RepID=A0ABC8KA11_ERUVS|nr:unnamed protein product [Eruca vesicaria subsp. sativa]